ncbi:MAG: hypothetical protein N2380_01125 [bacterium]|nr:hypothetical protein [bacterium]
MEFIAPSTEEWRKLFDLAMEFKEIKSWEWMSPMNIFGVQDPNTGKTCYFNVITFLEEDVNLYTLALYPGDSGLISLLDILSERHNEEEQFYFNDIIVVQFSDRKFLTKEDLEIIKSLGLKFRGKSEWISFKRMLPGRLPRIINKEEANLLLSTLEQVIDICLMFRDKPELSERDETLVRTSEKVGSNINWKDTWVELEYPVEELTIYNTSEIIETIKNFIRPQRTLEEWAIDFLFLSSPVKDDENSEEAYFPYFGLLINNVTGLGINFGVYKYSSEERLTYPVELFINTVEMTKRLPKSIFVRDIDIYNILSEIARPLNIEINLVEEIEQIENFKETIRRSSEEDIE